MKLRNISIKWKVMVLATAGPVIIATILAIQWVNGIKREAEQTVADKSKAIVLMAEATRDQMAKKLAMGVIKPFDEIEPSKVVEAVPVVTAIQTAKVNAEKAHYTFRVPKVNPRNPENEPTPFELAVLTELKEKDLKEKIIVTDKDIRYFKPIRLTEECLFCHGFPIGKVDPTGGRLEGWKVGEIHGAFEIISSLDPVKASVKKTLLTVATWGVGVLALCTVVSWLLLNNNVLKPLHLSSMSIKRIAGKDLSGTFDDRINKDEFGAISLDLHNMKGELQEVLKNIAHTADVLERESGDLDEAAADLTRSSVVMNDSSVSVAAAAEELSGNMNTVAAATEEASTNIALVAEATDGMARTITEITRNTENAKQITANAVSKATSASSKVDELGFAASRIGKVTETITEISEQTNLLALNATIEAARAGEAGKGFAVVANEIKNLAHQTAAATAEIKIQINGIQTSTSGTIEQIEQISTVINEVNDIVGVIVHAMEKQNTATSEIAENISQATIGIQEVTENVNQSSIVSADVARDIEEVSSNSTELTRRSERMATNAKSLSHLAKNLRKVVSEFKL
ncbi:MAG: methyl-accepting chemotaxis protein [Desulfopila sp.]